MFNDDGSLDPFLKGLLYLVLAAATVKMVWDWLTTTALPWITVDLWGAVTASPWWTTLLILGLLAGGGLVTWALRTLRYLRADHHHSPPTYRTVVPDEDDEDVLTYKMWELSGMSGAEFEHACARLLVRDGFTDVRVVGGAGDLGADVIATGPAGERLVFQCKRYARPVASGAVQQFNGTARPEHGADHAVIIGLNGFTDPAMKFAARHQLTAMDRPALKRWAHGQHLYDAVHTTASL
ncbi:restriction endonuclease [Streptomyces sp. B29(2018)]|uniref:restriction endonuclease n=1 Tax=Streptomyces sp. B29(2018) TaxID=2485016 RepID=UPI000FD6693B|nr:restriction endonuclease [Streptomyces sp. B29(2018)]